MKSITFATPTLSTASMARQDQIDVVVNQATAAIVCCYLEHMNVIINKNDTAPLSASTYVITSAELVSLVNDVQGALRTIT